MNVFQVFELNFGNTLHQNKHQKVNNFLTTKLANRVGKNGQRQSVSLINEILFSI